MLRERAGACVTLSTGRYDTILAMNILQIFNKKQKNTVRIAQLRKFNLIMAGLHAVQAVAVIVLSTDFRLPITTGYLTFDAQSNTLLAAQRRLFDMPFAWLVAAFFIMSAVAHLTVATVYRRSYEAQLQKGMNKARWIEYSLSASTMMVAIGMLAGIYDLSTLFMMFVLTAGMNLMGLVMEVWNQKASSVNWLSYWIGVLLGAAPWLVYVLYLWASAVYGDAQPPTFVYFILGSIFLMFNTFAINMWLQYRKKGAWADYLYGERAYIVLSLVAKSLLAWQVFAGTLRP